MQRTSWAPRMYWRRLEKLRSVRAVVCVTTDKGYQNQEWVWPYRETDTAGRIRSLFFEQGLRRDGKRGLSQFIFPVGSGAGTPCCAGYCTGRKRHWRRRLVGRPADSRPDSRISSPKTSAHPAARCDSSLAACAGISAWIHDAGRTTACGAGEFASSFNSARATRMRGRWTESPRNSQLSGANAPRGSATTFRARMKAGF